MARPTNYKGNQLVWLFGNLYSYSNTTFNYLYDNTRIYKSSNIATVYYHYQNGQLLGETRNNVVIKYLYDQSGIIGFSYKNTVYRYIKNLQGDIVAIYKGATKVAEYAYDAWGNCTIKQDTDGIGTFNAIRYRGYYYDVETGLYYLMTRYYDPTTGRFLSPDNVSYLAPGTIQGLNLFAYCNNNPIINVDPDGTSSNDLFVILERVFLGIGLLCEYLTIPQIYGTWKNARKYIKISLRQFNRQVNSATKSAENLSKTLGTIANAISFGLLVGEIANSWVTNYQSGNDNWVSDSMVDTAYLGLRYSISAGVTALCSLIPVPVLGTSIGIGLSISADYFIQWLVEDTGLINEVKTWAADVGQAITDGWDSFCNGWQWFWSFSWI